MSSAAEGEMMCDARYTVTTVIHALVVCLLSMMWQYWIVGRGFMLVEA